MSETLTQPCVQHSKSGIACGRTAMTYIDGKWLCVLHAQEAQTKAGRKRR